MNVAAGLRALKRDPFPDLPPAERAHEFADLDARTARRLSEEALKAGDVRTCVAAVVGAAIDERAQDASFVRQLLPRIRGLFAMVYVVVACGKEAARIVEPLMTSPRMSAPQRAMALCALEVADPVGYASLRHHVEALRNDPGADLMTHAILDVAMFGSSTRYRGDAVVNALRRARTVPLEELLVFEERPAAFGWASDT